MTDPSPTGSLGDLFASVEWERCAAHARESLIPMIKDCRVMVLSRDRTDPDPQQAIELGIMILLDKPIIAVLAQDSSVFDLPPKLAKIIDAVILGPISRPGFAAELKALGEQVSR